MKPRVVQGTYWQQLWNKNVGGGGTQQTGAQALNVELGTKAICPVLCHQSRTYLKRLPT